jgi:hypothetical protein
MLQRQQDRWLLATGFVVVACAQTVNAPKLLSPRLAALQEEVSAGNASAVQSFWSEIGTHAPLVEPIPGSPKEASVTFLWRDQGSTNDVVVVARLNGVAPFQDPQSHLVQLKATDVWYRTYRLPVESLLPISSH